MTIRSIELLALWGNGDAEGRVHLSRREWNHVCRGGELSRSGHGCYEGEWFTVDCHFAKGRADLTGDHGADYWSGSVRRLMARDTITNKRLDAPDLASVPPDPPKPTQVFAKDIVRKAHLPAALAALHRIATPAAQPIATDDAMRAPQTLSVDGATATLTPGEGRRAPTLRIESMALRVRVLREIGCFEDEVADYEKKQTLRNKAK